MPLALARAGGGSYTPARNSSELGALLRAGRIQSPADMLHASDHRWPPARHAQAALLLLLAVAALSATGCVRRRLTVRTHPPGAQVFVDEQEIGTTPCSASFIYYGTREITVMKDGYKTETIWQTFDPPWYELPVLEFVSENLVAREIRDERIVDVQLIPQEIVPPERLLDRAQSLRDSAQTGAITPLLNLPPGAAPSRQPLPKIGLPGDGLPGGDPLPFLPLPAP